MKIDIVNPNFVDMAWKDGASCLGEALKAIDEITGDQLKMILARGDRILCKLSNAGETLGWGACRIDQLPNMRVLHITDLVCHNANFEQFFPELCDMARRTGASEVRFSGKDAQCRLFERMCGFEKVYTTMRFPL